MRKGSGAGFAFVRAHVNHPHADSDPCVFWPFRTTNGYGSLDADGKAWRAHVLLLTLRDGPAPADKPHAIHGPCNRPSCITHVRWGTLAENAADKHRDGTAPVGERNSKAKLTDDLVRQIRARYAAGGTSYRKLAAEFGFGQTTIKDVVRRNRWSHVS